MAEPQQAELLQRQRQRMQTNLAQIKHRVVVFSGKGGVGKTTVAVNLAFALIRLGQKVGLLDADVTGPNVPEMIGLHKAPFGDESGIEPLQKAGLEVISVGFLIGRDQPVIWKGPLRSNLLRQFLADVRWGALDFLVADLPPGTGDEVLTMAQDMKPELALVVTTPQEIALTDTRRAVRMAFTLKIPKIGVIENMSGFVCPNCGHRFDIFDVGGGEREAKELGVRFLGRLPIDIRMREGADRGIPVALERPDSDSGRAFLGIASEILEMTRE